MLPLVLLHAFPLHSDMWQGVLAQLPDHDILTVDAPGFGASPAAVEVARAVGRGPEPALETYADAVAATLRAAGVERPSSQACRWVATRCSRSPSATAGC